LELSLQALFTYLCDLCAFKCAISPLIFNISPLIFNTTNALESKTPQEAWTGRKPDVSHLRIFDCKAFAYIPNEKRSKLESKSMPRVFLGYCEGIKAYRLMCVETKRIIKNRDVVFLEGQEK
jgi:hypothetical protein